MNVTSQNNVINIIFHSRTPLGASTGTDMCPQDSMLCCAAAAAHCKKGHEPVQLRWGIIPISDDPCHVIADALGAETSEGNAFFSESCTQKTASSIFCCNVSRWRGYFLLGFRESEAAIKIFGINIASKAH